MPRSQIWNTIDNDPNGTLHHYRVGMSIASTLLGVHFNGAPGWLNYPGRIVVKEFAYDRLGQQLKVRNRPTSTRQWRQDRSMAQNRALIQNLVARKGFTQTSISVRPAVMPKGRVHCDNLPLSSINNALSGEGGKYDFDPSTGTCSNCRLLNRPCTFTVAAQATELLQTGRTYADLGLSTNVYHMGSQDVVQEMHTPPFDPDMDFDN